MTLDSEPDGMLVGRIVNGEPEAARVLVERYSHSLRRFISHTGVRSPEIDDLIQETWLRVVRSAGRYDPLQPFPGWLFAIAMNRIRTLWTRNPGEQVELIEIASGAPPADMTVEASETAAAVRSLVLSLPRHLADTILLRFFEELTEREVAHRLGIPVGTVKSRLHHGIRKLRDELERMLHA